MAHADYNCCAICDSKLEYNGFDATTKERICESCLKNIRKLKLDILGIDEFIEWINFADIEILREDLIKLHFRFCYYKNSIDDLLDTKGIRADKKTRLVLERD